VTRATQDVAGGEIVRDARGEPTGLLKDNAMRLVDRVVPVPSEQMRTAR
jgi:predicted amidohydrolase YtcJ